MPKLLDIETGKPVEVTELEVPGKIASGKFYFDPAETYRLRNDSGNVVEITGEAAPTALRDFGFTFITREGRLSELKQIGEEEYYTSTDQQILAGLEGAARGATVGLSDVVLGGEAASKRREYNPKTATVTELGGAVIPALLSGGATAPESGASIGRAIIARTPAALVSRVGPSIATGGIGRAALGYGLEGSIWGAGQFVSDVALGDKELTAEGLMGSARDGALWGGGFGAAFTAAGAGLNRLTRGKATPEEVLAKATPEEIAAREAMDLQEATERAGATTLIDYKGNAAYQKKLAAAEARAGKQAARDAAKAERQAAKEARDFDRAKTQPLGKYQPRPETIRADEVIPKHEVAKGAGRAADDFADTLNVHRGIGVELDNIASKQVEIDALSHGENYARKLNDAIEEFRAEAKRFDAWLAAGNHPHAAPTSHTLHHERKFLDLAKKVSGDVPEAVQKAEAGMAREYGHGIAMRQRAAARAGEGGAAKKAAEEALPRVPPESLGKQALDDVEKYGRWMRKEGVDLGADIGRGGKATAFPRFSDLGEEGVRLRVSGDEIPVGRFLDVNGKPIEASSDVALESIRKIFRKGQKAVDDMWGQRGVQVSMRPNGRMDVVDGRHRLLVAKEFPNIKVPIRVDQGVDVNTLPGIGTMRSPAAVSPNAVDTVRLKPLRPKPSQPPARAVAGEIPVDKARAAELAEGLDRIEAYERATLKLYKEVKPAIKEPATQARYQEYFKKAESAVSKSEARGERFATFKDALMKVELLQELGVPGIPDVQKVPVIGPLLGAYARWRFFKRAGSKLGILRSADASVGQKAAQTRNRLADGVQKFLKKKGNRKAAVVPGAAAILNSPLFHDSGEGKPAADIAGTKKVKKGLDAADLFRKRAAELRAAKENGAEALRKIVNVHDPELQDAIERAYQRKVDFLLSKLPTDPTPPNALGLPSMWEPSKAELNEFAQFVRGVDDLPGTMEDLANGTITPQAVDAWKATSPKLYNEVREMIIDQAASMGDKLDYGQRVSLSIMFEAPLHPSMEPAYLAAMQQSFEEAAKKPQPQPSFAGSVLGELEMYGQTRRSGR